MPDIDSSGLEKTLKALLLIQLEALDEVVRFSVLVRAGWSNAEIAGALGLSENAIAVRRTRLKHKIQKEKS